MKVYADHAATTPMRESAKAAMIECLEEYGNPSSIHAAGRLAAMKLESARKEVAELLNCRPAEIYFTSGGTEADNWAKIRAALNEFCGYTLEDTEVILFLIGGAWYFMADIGLRMLTPRELYRANGFPDDYKIERDYTGKEYGKTKQVTRCGNAVPPPFSTALVRANLPEWCGEEITTMAQFEKAVAV